MGSIISIVRVAGNEVYRIRLKRKDSEVFSLSFNDYGRACDWIEQNEKKFFETPEVYFQWRADLVRLMRRNREKVHDGIIRPKLRSSADR